MTPYSGKKIIIIGASSGIGKELTRLYAATGARIGITARRQVLLHELEKNFPGQIEWACFDVMGNENISQLENLIQKMGGLDLIIYNSGYGETCEGLDWSIDKKTVLTNVNGFVEIVNFSFNYFLKQGHGHIAATSSLASFGGNSFAPAYSASKAFMSTYMEGLFMKARRLKVDITITDIQPGFVKTSMAKAERRFWEAPVAKAALQIQQAIEAKRFRVYITKRWWLIAQLLKLLPAWVYRRIG